MHGDGESNNPKLGISAKKLTDILSGLRHALAFGNHHHSMPFHFRRQFKNNEVVAFSNRQRSMVKYSSRQ